MNRYEVVCQYGFFRSLTLSSGRVITPNQGLVGINVYKSKYDGSDGFTVVEGYDNQMLFDLDGETWTADEKQELADLMIARWQAFKEHVG